MSKNNKPGLFPVIISTLERGRKYPFYFFAIPGIIIIIQIVFSFSLMPFFSYDHILTPDAGREKITENIIHLWMISLPFWLIVYPILGLAQTRIAVRCAMDQPESPLTSVFEGVKRYPRLVFEGILFFLIMIPVAIVIIIVMTILLLLTGYISSQFSAISGIVTILSAFLIYALMIFGAGTILLGITNIFVIRIVTRGKKEIRTAFSYAMDHIGFIYPLHLIGMLSIVIIMAISYIPIIRQYMDIISSASPDPGKGEAINQAMMTQQLLDIISNPGRILLFGISYTITYYIAFLLIAVTANYYISRPPQNDPAEEPNP